MSVKDNAVTFNVVLEKEGREWVAHCLELDIVATSANRRTVLVDMARLIAAQVGYAFANNNLDNLYHPAPPEVWEKFYRCKKQEKKRVPLAKATRRGGFVPPVVYANTCCA